MISDFIFCREPLLRFPKKINNPNPSPIGNKFGLFLSGRSGETRTRGLLLPKQARYQLRNTPASGGTAAPPEYSISFFARFVNTESAVRGIGTFRLFQPIKAAVRKRAMTGIFCKRRGFGATAEKRMQKLDRTQNLLRSSCKQAGKVLS
jgi:hypothetical protein